MLRAGRIFKLMDLVGLVGPNRVLPALDFGLTSFGKPV